MCLLYFRPRPKGKPYELYYTPKARFMDKFDNMILDIIQSHKKKYQNHIKLSALEEQFWKRIEQEETLSIGKARIGERITKLYLTGLIQNKQGYMLTKKGREQLRFATQPATHLA